MRKRIALAVMIVTATSFAGSASGMASDAGAEAPTRQAIVRSTAFGPSRRFGPFRVIDEQTAELDGATDSRSPAQFVRMTSEFPHLRVLRMADCPGTIDDVANLRLGRLIHARGMATIVPSSGSVRSGAVEIFIAGVGRTVESGAEFAVHAWSDRNGFEVADLRATDPISQAYLAYYVEMGLSEKQARKFYALTNSVKNEHVIWLTADQIARYISIKKTT